VVEDGLARRTPITLGASSIGAIEIASGVNEGDEIIISGTDTFGDAEIVRLTD
jgi:HlyD family secretion protein